MMFILIMGSILVKKSVNIYYKDLINRILGLFILEILNKSFIFDYNLNLY